MTPESPTCRTPRRARRTGDRGSDHALEEGTVGRNKDAGCAHSHTRSPHFHAPPASIYRRSSYGSPRFTTYGAWIERAGVEPCKDLAVPVAWRVSSVRVPARPWLTVDSHSDCVRLAALLGSSGRRAIG